MRRDDEITRHYEDLEPRFAMDDGAEDVALHAALDRFGAADRKIGDVLMTAAERLASLPRDVQDMILADVVGVCDTPAPVFSNNAPLYQGWGINAEMPR